MCEARGSVTGRDFLSLSVTNAFIWWCWEVVTRLDGGGVENNLSLQSESVASRGPPRGDDDNAGVRARAHPPAQN